MAELWSTRVVQVMLYCRHFNRTHPEESRNRALKVNSFTTTPAEIVAEFEKQTGEKWSVSYTLLEKVHELEKKAYTDKS
jgi:hypothetical protein